MPTIRPCLRALCAASLGEGELRFDQPGCYQLDVTGPRLHESLVVQAAAGAVPLG
jgi:hypothetical protein